jgi:hypothetical protein
MFILDSLMIAGIRWALETTITAAEAEMNDDTALREQLLEAEMRREMGEISDQDFAALEADLLGRIRAIKERREGAGPLAFGGAQPMETSPDTGFQIEASVSGDFHRPEDAPHTTVVDTTPAHGQIFETEAQRTISVDLHAEGAEDGAPSVARRRSAAPTRAAASTRAAAPPRAAASTRAAAPPRAAASTRAAVPTRAKRSPRASRPARSMRSKA